MIDVASIRRVPLFRDFADDEAAAVAATVTDRRYGKHQFIVREGDPGDTFFILVKGSISVCRIAPDGRETILSILKEGDFFGEMSLLDGAPRSATVVAEQDMRVTNFDRGEFVRLVEVSPKIALKLLAALATRLRAVDQGFVANYG